MARHGLGRGGHPLCRHVYTHYCTHLHPSLHPFTPIYTHHCTHYAGADWVEIYNAGSESVSLAGYVLYNSAGASDDSAYELQRSGYWVTPQEGGYEKACVDSEEKHFPVCCSSYENDSNDSAAVAKAQKEWATENGGYWTASGAGGFYTSNPDGGLRWKAVVLGSYGYCSTLYPCGLGQGHCRHNDDCLHTLVCAVEAGEKYGLPEGSSACIPAYISVGGASCGHFTASINSISA